MIDEEKSGAYFGTNRGEFDGCIVSATRDVVESGNQLGNSEEGNVPIFASSFG
jgi:hypothetical protein